MKVGLCGLPQSGKTTLFNALTSSSYELHAYGGGAVRVNQEVTTVHDADLLWLHELTQSKKLTAAQIEYLDVSGLAKGDSGGTVAARFLAELRRADALLIVLRAFEDNALPHPDGSVNPTRDLESFYLELGVADLSAVTTRLGSVGRGVNRADKKAMAEVELEQTALELVSAALEEGLPASSVTLTDQQYEAVRGLGLFTHKPAVVVLNADLDGRETAADIASVNALGFKSIVVHGKLELEIAGFDEDEAAEYRQEFELPDGILDSLVALCYETLGLHSYYTTGPKETRAWTVRRNATAVEAAKVIHSDIARGFIRAEVAGFADLQEHGSMSELKKRGLYRTEGKEYVVQSQDVILFRFQV